MSIDFIGIRTVEEKDKKKCPKCGKLMQKWFIIGGRTRWECSHCGYKEKAK